MSMNPRTYPNAQNQHGSYWVCPFPGAQIPSVLLPNDLQNGVRYVSPGGGVFTNSGLTCSCVLNTLPEAPDTVPSGSGKPAGLSASQVRLYQNVILQRGRALQGTNQHQSASNRQPGLASLEMLVQDTPSVQNESVQSSLPWPTMRINSEYLAGSSTEERSSFTSLRELRDFQNPIWPSTSTSRQASPIDICLRQSRQQQRSWDFRTQLQEHEEKNRDAEIFREEKTNQSNGVAVCGNERIRVHQRESLRKRDSTHKKMRFKDYCSQVSGFQAPLHYAIWMNDRKKLRHLLKTKDPNIYLKVTGETPMHLACRLGNLCIVKLLQRHPKIDMTLPTVVGAEASSKPGLNALQLALDNRNYGVVSFLINYASNENKTKNNSKWLFTRHKSHDVMNTELAHLDILKKENQDLKEKIKELEVEDVNVMGVRLPRDKPTDTKKLAEVLKVIRELERDLITCQQRIWSEKEDEKQCNICAERNKNTVLVPCGHFFCSVCAHTVELCPNCRTPIESRVRTFDSSI